MAHWLIRHRYWHQSSFVPEEFQSTLVFERVDVPSWPAIFNGTPHAYQQAASAYH